MCQGEILNTLPFGGIFYISFISFSFQFSFPLFPTEIETPTFWRLIFSQGLGSVRSAMALGAVAIARLFGRAAKRRGGFHIAYKVYMLILGKTSVTSATCYDSARFQLGLLNGLRVIFHCWVEGEKELFLESVWLATTAVRRHIVYQIASHFLHQQAPNGARFSSNFLQSSSQCPVGPSYTLLRSAQDSLRRWLLCYPQCAPGNWVNFWWLVMWEIPLHRSEDSGKPHMYEFYASHGSHGGHGAQIHLCYKSILPKYSQILPFSCRATVNTDCLAKTKHERSLSCPKVFKVHMMSCRCTGVCRRQSNESIVFSLES